LIEPGGQALKIVTHAEINCQLTREGPMILHESAETRYRKIHVRVPERLPKLVGISSDEISDRARKIYGIEAIWYVRPQPDAIHRSAGLPKMFSSCARVCVAGLIMVFRAW